MSWILIGTALSILLAEVVTVLNNARFARRVRREVAALWKARGEAPVLERRALDRMPAGFRRYLELVLGPEVWGRRRAPRTLRLTHRGTFRTALDGDWLPIQGVQYFAADPPGFVWWGRVHVAPFLWVDALDRSVEGTGRMRVSLESSHTFIDSAGPELDQSALQRLLGELVWMPSAFLDERTVTSVVELSANLFRATLCVAGREVQGTFELDEEGLVQSFYADRYRDVGSGEPELTPFVGECDDYRRVDGILVPHQMDGSWVVKGERCPFVRFHVDALDFDPKSPWRAPLTMSTPPEPYGIRRRLTHAHA